MKIDETGMVVLIFFPERAVVNFRKTNFAQSPFIYYASSYQYSELGTLGSKMCFKSSLTDMLYHNFQFSVLFNKLTLIIERPKFQFHVGIYIVQNTISVSVHA